MKIIANDIGREFLSIVYDDNGYIQDVSCEVISKKSELEQKKSELEQKKSELEQKKSELEQKKSELEQKKSELQVFFVGVLDDISIVEMYDYLKAGQVTKNLYTNRHYNYGWNCFCEYWTWNANFSFAFIGTAGSVANIQNTLLKKIKDAKGSVTNFRYHPNCYGLTTWDWRVDDGFKGTHNGKKRIDSRRLSVYHVRDHYVRHIANLFFDYHQYQEHFIKITSAYFLIQNIRAIEAEIGLIENDINSIKSELNTQINLKEEDNDANK